jgi:hypothetical protein
MRQREDPDWVNVAHDHPDQNHFLLFASGRMMAVNDGYPQEQKLTRSHNTIVVDGAGQTREGEARYQPFPYEETGTMDDVFLSRASAYAAGNASLLYEGAERFVRHLVFVEGQYVVILDDLVGARGTSHTYEWRLHKDASVEGADAAADGTDASADGSEGEGQASGGEKGCGCRVGGGTSSEVPLVLLVFLFLLAISGRPSGRR